MNLQCANCKAINSGNAQFCNGCGVILTNPNPPKKTGASNAAILAAVAVLVTILSCGLCAGIGALIDAPKKDRMARDEPSSDSTPLSAEKKPTKSKSPSELLEDVKEKLSKEEKGSKLFGQIRELINQMPKDSSQSKEAEQLLEKAKKNYVDIDSDGLEVVKARWEKGGFGTVAVWKVTIKNISDQELGDFKFATTYYSETGNVVDRGGTKGLLGKDTIQKSVKPKRTRTFEISDGFVNSEAERANFELVSWEIID